MRSRGVIKYFHFLIFFTRSEATVVLYLKPSLGYSSHSHRPSGGLSWTLEASVVDYYLFIYLFIYSYFYFGTVENKVAFCSKSTRQGLGRLAVRNLKVEIGVTLRIDDRRLRSTRNQGLPGNASEFFPVWKDPCLFDSEIRYCQHMRPWHTIRCGGSQFGTRAIGDFMPNVCFLIV